MFERRPHAKHINQAKEELDLFLSYEEQWDYEEEGIYVPFEDMRLISALLNPNISDEVYYQNFRDGVGIHS